MSFVSLFNLHLRGRCHSSFERYLSWPSSPGCSKFCNTQSPESWQASPHQLSLENEITET